MAYKTRYNPKNTNKYIGDHTQINCRSLWERSVCKFCDDNPNIIKWSFEELMIPYINPITKKLSNYIPDFLIQINNKGVLESWVVEVKPKKQTFLKENSSKKEKITWAINNSKWNAAKKYCSQHKLIFKLLTEKEIF